MSFDFDELAEGAADNIVQRALASVYEPIANYVSVNKARFFEDFGVYYRYIFEKCSKVRTIVGRSGAQSISQIYIPTKFYLDGYGSRVAILDTELVAKVRGLERIVIKGNGGTGKTVFLKYLWLSLFARPEGRIPLFVELRRLNDISKLDVVAFCRSELQSTKIFSDAIFRRLAQDGKFVFIFDGFDELDRSKRKDVEQQINKLALLYQDCGMVVSSRDDDRFGAWASFQVYSVAELTLEDARQLIGKIEFDKKTKDNFLKIATSDFYDEHRHFLVTPLLCTMMLMTFHQNAAIPEKLSSFYRNAFSTMLLWHDATKDSFERERALDQDSFRVMFATFCFITYISQTLEFEDKELADFINKALDYVSRLGGYESLSEISVEDVKLDFWQSANLIQKDGIHYVFLHRSFQEFFAAEFSMSYLNENIDKALERFATRLYDNALAMAFEINPDKVVEYYLDKQLALLEQSGIVGDTSVVRSQILDIDLTFEFSSPAHHSPSSGPRIYGTLETHGTEIKGAIDSLSELFPEYTVNEPLSVFFEGSPIF